MLESIYSLCLYLAVCIEQDLGELIFIGSRLFIYFLYIFFIYFLYIFYIFIRVL